MIEDLMKKLALLSLLMSLTTVSLALPLSALGKESAEGTKDGGGGNAQVSAFYKMAETFNARMQVVGTKVYPGFPTAELKVRMQTLQVISVPGPLTLGEIKVDAINYPSQNRIELDDATWAQRAGEEKYQIVVHEILGLLSIDDFQYKVSRRLAKVSAEDADPTLVGKHYHLGAKERFERGKALYNIPCSAGILSEVKTLAENKALADCFYGGYRSCKVIHSYTEAKEPNGRDGWFCLGQAIVEGREGILNKGFEGDSYGRNEAKYLKNSQDKICSQSDVEKIVKISAERAKADCLAAGWENCNLVFSRKTDMSPKTNRDAGFCNAFSMVEGFSRVRP